MRFILLKSAPLWVFSFFLSLLNVKVWRIYWRLTCQKRLFPRLTLRHSSFIHITDSIPQFVTVGPVSPAAGVRAHARIGKCVCSCVPSRTSHVCAHLCNGRTCMRLAGPVHARSVPRMFITHRGDAHNVLWKLSVTDHTQLLARPCVQIFHVEPTNCSPS